jgi:hypothetical protein
MATEPVCAQCGAPLPENAPGNRCPKCLLQLGLDETSCDAEPAKPSELADLVSQVAADPPLDSDCVHEQIGSRIGRYRLLQQIGEGGVGVVFMAEQTEPVQRKVALKVIEEF